MKQTFLLLHGWGGNGSDHWQNFLSSFLKQKGKRIVSPHFQNPDTPDLSQWLLQLKSFLENLSPSNVIIVAHSLGAALWIHFVSQHPSFQSSKAFLVAPTPDDCGISEIRSFFPLPSVELNSSSVVVASTNDPYISSEKCKLLAQSIGAQFQTLSNAGHISPDSGFGRWKWIEQKCLEA
ncbi:alpha/beta hydrolase [Candidatus Gracilibacteria bacterium]|nr:alpha/beta hydrolase [Candidatus Gracilibacteria bacterium]MCF7819738.1 alpha/beta hydrolase [Candidatus Gracilibacteria bacterium]